MKGKLIYCIFVLLFYFNCYNAPQKIPTGSWNYRLFTNGIRMGNAVISNQLINGNYVSTSELKLSFGGIINTSKQTIVETKNFKPLSLETINKTIRGNSIYTTSIKASINEGNIDLVSSPGERKSVIKIEKNFILDGNYFMAKFIEGKFKTGLSIEANIYDPSIEIDKPITIKTKVVGIEELKIKGKSERLIHLIQSIENIKNIDLYINAQGILIKGVIEMLNMKVELIKEQQS